MTLPDASQTLDELTTQIAACESRISGLKAGDVSPETSRALADALAELDHLQAKRTAVADSIRETQAREIRGKLEQADKLRDKLKAQRAATRAEIEAALLGWYPKRLVATWLQPGRAPRYSGADANDDYRMSIPERELVAQLEEVNAARGELQRQLAAVEAGA